MCTTPQLFDPAAKNARMIDGCGRFALRITREVLALDRSVSAV
jgi:hypothetical protein